jgi:hypothetical protein
VSVTFIASKQTKQDDDLFKIGLILTPPQVAQKFGISEDAARALVEAGLRSIRDQAQHSRLSLCPQ